MEFQNLVIKCYIEFRSIFVIWTISTSDSTSRREIGVFLKSRNIWFNASPCFPPAKWGSSATCALVILGEVLRSSLSQMAVYSQLSERASRAAIMNCPAFFCCKRGTLVMIKIAIPTAIRQANCLRNCDIAAGGKVETLLCVHNLCSASSATLKNSQSFVLNINSEPLPVHAKLAEIWIF